MKYLKLFEKLPNNKKQIIKEMVFNQESQTKIHAMILKLSKS